MPKCVSSGVGQDSANGFTRCVWLPPYNEAKIALDKYISNITFFHHVIHTPSLWAVMKEIYTDMNEQRQPNASHVALLLSIIASTTYSWTAIDCNGSLFQKIQKPVDKHLFGSRQPKTFLTIVTVPRVRHWRPSSQLSLPRFLFAISKVLHRGSGSCTPQLL